MVKFNLRERAFLIVDAAANHARTIRCVKCGKEVKIPAATFDEMSKQDFVIGYCRNCFVTLLPSEKS